MDEMGCFQEAQLSQRDREMPCQLNLPQMLTVAAYQSSFDDNVIRYLLLVDDVVFTY